MIIENDDKKYELASEYFKSGDYKKALVLYQDLAANGSRSATRFLGWMYLYGQGVDQDESKAVQLFVQSAEMGDAEAYFGLGKVFRRRGENRIAVSYLHKSVRSGFFPSAYLLGIIFEKESKFCLASRYYSIGADCGHLWSQRKLLILGWRGLSIQKKLLQIIRLIQVRMKIIKQAIKDPRDLSLFF